MPPQKDASSIGLPWYSSSFAVFVVAVVAAGVSFYALQQGTRSSFDDLAFAPSSSNTSHRDDSFPFGATSPTANDTNVPDCCCSSEDMQATNLQTVHPLLKRVVATPWFAHFAIDMDTTCPLWNDNPLCILRDCSVCPCEEPPIWAVPSSPTCEGDDDGDDYYLQEDRVVRTVDDHVLDTWQTTTPFPDGLPFLMDENAAAEPSSQPPAPDTTVVVDLRRNPERYTGYGGESAAKVWTAIHQDNAFSSNTTHPLSSAQRIYNRVLSGMHTSISLHIAHSYCHTLDPDRAGECLTWGPHPALAQERVSTDRWDNLHVAFAVVLRAVQTAGAAITAAVPEREDVFYADSVKEWTDVLLPAMTSLAATCPVAFDATALQQELAAVADITERLQHLQQIMQCVGCDRCKLWGTLQAQGVATALRIVMARNDTVVHLSRSQAVALVHTLERFSSALVYAEELLGQGKDSDATSATG